MEKHRTPNEELREMLERVEHLVMRAHEALPESFSELVSEMKASIQTISDRQAARIEQDDRYHENIDKHIARVEPVLKAYEAAQNVGWVGVKMSAFGLTLGAMYLMFKQIFH